MISRSVLSLALLLALGLSLQAGDSKIRVVDSSDSKAHSTSLLSKISWQTSLDQALGQARQDGKLVFWMQLKGKLDGMV